MNLSPESIAHPSLPFKLRQESLTISQVETFHGSEGAEFQWDGDFPVRISPREDAGSFEEIEDGHEIFNTQHEFANERALTLRYLGFWKKVAEDSGQLPRGEVFETAHKLAQVIVNRKDINEIPPKIRGQLKDINEILKPEGAKE